MAAALAAGPGGAAAAPGACAFVTAARLLLHAVVLGLPLPVAAAANHAACAWMRHAFAVTLLGAAVPAVMHAAQAAAVRAAAPARRPAPTPPPLPQPGDTQLGALQLPPEPLPVRRSDNSVASDASVHTWPSTPSWDKSSHHSSRSSRSVELVLEGTPPPGRPQPAALLALVLPAAAASWAFVELVATWALAPQQ